MSTAMLYPIGHQFRNETLEKYAHFIKSTETETWYWGHSKSTWTQFADLRVPSTLNGRPLEDTSRIIAVLRNLL